MLENNRSEAFIKCIYENTRDFNDALNAIADGHNKLCEKMKEQYIKNPDTFEFNMEKDASWVRRDDDDNIIDYNPPVRSIRQTKRKDEMSNKKIALDNPLFRLKMPVFENKMVLSWRNKKGEYETRDYIFDARKTIVDNHTGSTSLVPAKIKVNGKLQSLNVDNVALFMTYKSLISGYIEFPKIVISKQGFSLVNEFKQLIVKRYKAKLQQENIINSQILLNMKGESDAEEDEDLSEETIEILEKPKLQKSKPASVTESDDSSEDDLTL